jgi:acetyl esterase/lipase
MNAFLKMQVYLSALLGVAPFVRTEDRSLAALLWLPKLLAGALSPILGILGSLGAVLGLTRRDWKLAGAGFLGVGLAARYLRDIPVADGQFEAAFGADRTGQWTRRRSLPAGEPGDAQFQRNLVYGHNPASGKALLADLWQPHSDTPRTGLGVLYIHGGGWRIGTKDMATRTFFRRLTGQGHVILDIAYTLWPEADLPAMVVEVKQAIHWLKENAPSHGVDPERIVLMGGSAGAHLALLAAYTPNHPAFQPASDAGDTSVRGVVAFYPPVDFLTMSLQGGHGAPSAHSFLDKAASAMLDRLFLLHAEDIEAKVGRKVGFDNFVTALLGGSADEIPEIYRLLSPIYHVGGHCPPTLLLHGSDDVFGLTPGVRRLYRALQETDVPAILVEFPHTDHGFDLILPQVSPVARAATQDVARFLALLAK